MEKKTIGKFISALRRASGMTQKELGEKLFVSDKTVSRWERDECAPELTLIPALAEIFDVTADELLRGERNKPEQKSSPSSEAEGKQRAKSNKQFKLMLERNTRKYNVLSLISIGITIFGLIAAIIANLGFSRGLIAFCLASAFCVASEICQICFTVNARLSPDEDDDAYADRILKANAKAIKTATIITFINLIVFAFCLPLITMINGANYGLVFKYWVGYGLLFSAVALVVGYVLYALIIRKVLIKKGIIILTEKQASAIKANDKLLVKLLAISTAIALTLGACVIIWGIVGWDASLKELTFDTCAEFKAFMEGEYETWYKEGYNYVDENGDVVVHVPITPEVVTPSPDGEKTDEDYYPQKVYNKIYNSKGEVICEYYHNPNLYKQIIFNESADDKMPVTVITNQAHYNAKYTSSTVEAILYALIFADLTLAAAIYLIGIYKNKKSG